MAQLNVEEFLADFEVADDAEREALTKFFSREKNQKPAWQLKDYSRTMQELKAQREEMEEAVEQKRQAVERQAELLANWKQGQEAALAKAQADAAKAQKKIAKIAEEYGIDPEAVDEGGEPPKPRERTPPVDLAGYTRSEDMTRSLEMVVGLQADLLEVKEDYSELYGKPMRDTKGFLQEFAKAAQKKPGLTLPEFADQKFEFSTKREAMKEAALRKSIREELETEYQKRASEARLPYATPRREGQGSPLFRGDRAQPGKGQRGRGREAVLKHLAETGQL